MTEYRIAPSGPPPPDRIPYRDRWADDDLAKLRALLWWRLQLKADVTDAIADRMLVEMDRVARQYRRHGEKLRRLPEGRSWGLWLQKSARELRRWTRAWVS